MPYVNALKNINCILDWYIRDKYHDRNKNDYKF